MVVKILNGDCREMLKTLPDKSIHCCVTSPPYYGLRSYCSEGSEEKELEIGLEQSPEEYVQSLVEVFREVKRVLRDDGTLWLNLGDSYNGSGGNHKQEHKNDTGFQGVIGAEKHKGRGNRISSLKPKDLIGIPWRVAFALQADGWYLRQDIIWSKNNPMPESVKDRCTKSHEYIFLLSKSKKYYFDNEAIKEESVTCDPRRPYTSNGAKQLDGRDNWHSGEPREPGDFTKRNKRSVWQVNTKPYKGAHFATFPPALIEPCILAGTSERGVCSECGFPYERITEITGQVKQKWGTTDRPDCRPGNIEGKGDKGLRTGMVNIKNTVGWQPSCSCNAPSTPATVLDPFGGSGTVGQWCNLNGRDAILIELNPEYIPLIEERINTVPKPSKKKATECIEEDFEAEEELSIEDLEKAMSPEEQNSYYNLLLGVPFEYFEMVRKAYWVEKGVV